MCARRTKRARSPGSLPPLLRAVRSVIVVDNGSADGTADVRAPSGNGGRRFPDRLDVRSYPFAVARCGEEHLSTSDMLGAQPRVLLQLVVLHVRTAYSLKWDADMVLTDAAVSVSTA